jgi:hypothetical protein
MLPLLGLLVAVVCVLAWAVEEAPSLAVVPLPISAREIPGGPLVAAAVCFFVAWVIHPKGAQERRRD